MIKPAIFKEKVRGIKKRKGTMTKIECYCHSAKIWSMVSCFFIFI